MFCWSNRRERAFRRRATDQRQSKKSQSTAKWAMGQDDTAIQFVKERNVTGDRETIEILIGLTR
jgi:hypothetical protein